MTKQNIILTQIPLEELQEFIEQTVEKAVLKALKIHSGSNENNNEKSLEGKRVNIDTLCRIYNWPKQTVYGWVHHRVIPNSRIGRRLSFDLNEINEWIKTGKRKTKLQIQNEANRFLQNKDRYTTKLKAA